jgi:hypothetical protein
MKKNITKKKNTKETRKKPCEEKQYQFIVFCEESYNVFLHDLALLVFTCNCNS